MVCEHNGTAGSELYNTTSATDNPKSTSTTVGINDNQLTNINIYHNPTNGLLVIENAKGYYLTIFNSLGKSVYSSFVIDDTYTSDFNNFADVMYFLKLDVGGGSISQKIILRR